MSLKKLNQFLKFDYARFHNGKILQVIGLSEWKEYKTEKHLGVKIETVITKDATEYIQKEGEKVSNLYEKLIFKCPKDIKVPLNAIIEPINPVATVYGDFRNQLSIVVDDIRVITPSTRTVESPKVRG